MQELRGVLTEQLEEVEEEDALCRIEVVALGSAVSLGCNFRSWMAGFGASNLGSHGAFENGASSPKSVSLSSCVHWHDRVGALGFLSHAKL